MGYLIDNTPIGRFSVFCTDLYPFRIIITPGFNSDRDLQTLVKDVIPDVEEWQFSGRRRCPLPKGKQSRIIHPATYAHNSRKMREFTELVVFAFHTAEQRSQVAARLDTQLIKYTIEDEPTPQTPVEDDVFIIIP